MLTAICVEFYTQNEGNDRRDMAKKRVVDTKFWNDNFIVELDPLEKYLFLYFLTNEHTNIAGIYELPLRVMAFETGIDKETLPKMIDRFGDRIKYIDGWVYIKNFIKNQDTTSKDLRYGISKVLRTLPKRVLEGVSKSIDPLTLSDILESEPEPKLESKLKKN